MIRKILVYYFLLLGFSVQAQVSVTASAPSVVNMGEEFQLVYTISAEPSGFKAPDLSLFNLLSGPNRSSSSSISIVNGNISQSVTITFSYILQGKQAGKFTIEPAKVTAGGKNYLSNPIQIEVVNNGGGSQQQTQQGTQQGQQNVDIPDDKVFLKVIVDKSSLFQGEYLTATVKFYSQVNVNDLGNFQLPQFKGVYSQDLEIPSLNSLNRENLNGKTYLTGVIKQYHLFPQQTGEITIGSFKIDAVVAQKTTTRSRSPFDDFWGFDMGPSIQWVKKTVTSKPVKISVKALPSGAPESFKGAVGNFSFKASIDKNKVKTNDAISLKASINGSGNIKLIDPIEIKTPADFEVYDPKTNVNVKGANGTKSFEYVMIPRHSGNFTIPPVEFTYFDPQSKQYKTLRSEEFSIAVEKGRQDEETRNVVSGGNRGDIKYLGQDIRFIKTGVVPMVMEGNWFFGSCKFYLAYAIAFALFLIFVIVKRKQIIENANIAKVRNKRANKQAQKRLKQAAVCMKEEKKETFYEEVLKALWGYLSDKFNIAASELSREKVVEILRAKNASEEQIQNLNAILDDCELARYAPSAVSSDLKGIYDKAAELISKFENIF